MNKVEIRSNSAITVLNAIATGIGSAIGIKADNKVTISKSEDLQINVHPEENDDRLIRTCLTEFEKITDIEIDKLKISTYSDLPPQRGLKTSSAISTAIIAGLTKIYGINLQIDQIINIAAKASISAKVSITGAIDDAYASFLGSGYITDNKKMKIIQHIEPPDDKSVILLIPKDRLPKMNIRNLTDEIDQKIIHKAINKAKNGKIEEAIELNTKAYAPLIYQKPKIIDDLINNFQHTVGLNGAGPSLFMLVPANKSDQIYKKINEFTDNFKLIQTKFTTRRKEYDQN